MDSMKMAEDLYILRRVRLSQTDLTMVIPTAGALSFVYALLLYVNCFRRWRSSAVKGEATASGANPFQTETRGFSFWMKDGPVIFSFRIVRLVAVTGLIVLEIVQCSKEEWGGRHGLLAINYVFIAILCLIGLLTSPETRDLGNKQASILLLFDFAVYFFLDAWPFVMISNISYLPETAKARLVFLTTSGVLVPLISPRPFRPSDDGEKPVPAHVAPVLSRLTYSFMDSLIFRAWKVPHIGVEDLPPIPLKEEAEILRQRTFHHLDPVILQKKRYLLWGMLRVFGKDYVEILFWMLANGAARFAAPYGMKNLLLFVETGISPFNLKPWVWILVLALGPVITAFLNNQWLYIGTRTIAEMDSIVTQLVFEHSLRIRLNQGLAKKDVDNSKSNPGQDSSTSSPEVESEASEETAVEGETDSGDDISDSTIVPIAEGDQKTETKPEIGHIVGRINNLLTSDLTTLDYSYSSLLLGSTLLQLGISIWFLYEVVGWSAFVGTAAIVVLMPVPTYLGKLVITSQIEKMQCTDKRVQGVTESLGVLRMIKLFAWESRILDDLSQRRSDELRVARKQRLIEMMLNFFSSCMPLVSKLSTLFVYALVMKGEISASRIFSALMVFTMLEENIHSVVRRVPDILKVKVAYDRFDEFINGTHILTTFASEKVPEEQAGMESIADSAEIGFKDCSFTWDDPLERNVHPLGRRKRLFKLRVSDKLTFVRDGINLIVGPTGSGKTSILMALLGEMHYEAHGPQSWYRLPREHGIAYVPQESWVLNDTIRNNILLGLEYNEERYTKVLQQCALERDLALLEAGDKTEVGEKGLTLSGGQKTRITLARAIYSEAKVLLLDDILAALDVHTSKWIVDKALSGDLIEGRTVLLVTHNIALSAPIASRVVVLGKNGLISSVGTVDEVLRSDSQLLAQTEEERLEEAKELAKEDESKIEETGEEATFKTQKSGKLVIAEEVAIGRVAWKSTKLYLQSYGGLAVWTTTFGLEICLMLVNIYQKWIMGYWSNQYEKHPASKVNSLTFILLYATGSILEQIIEGFIGIFYVFRTLVASRVISDKLMRSIFSSTFRWLDVTPVGRIITRCTQDISKIDQEVPGNLFAFLYFTVFLSMYFATSVVMAGMYAVVPGVMMLGLGFFLGHVYLKSSLCMRREMSNLKGPMISQVTTALGALASIRAYGAQGFFREALKEKVNSYTRASLAFYDTNRWIAVRVETLGGLFAGTVSFYFIYGSNMSAGYIGFTLSMLVNFSRVILSWVRVYNEFELQSNSIERIQGYLEIEHESPPSTDGVPPAYWPSSGRLKVENLCARYSEDSPEILHNLSFDVASGERIGIVGRTGAGKSTITLALLRAIKTSGKVFYDGIATDTINLDALRSNITLIPQQPELIRGTLRENLNPFGSRDDAELNAALRAAGLFDLHAVGHESSATEAYDAQSQAGSSTLKVAFPNPSKSGSNSQVRKDGSIGLDSMVESGGTNFSLGQRQIVALARAIVRRSKLLILDEATAAIDYATDTAIQKALRTEFDKDTTFITVAHRLQTVMDYDKILVLDDGNLIEFDSPAHLLANEKGLLRALVNGSQDRETLMQMAGITL